ncbi:MAG: nitrilase-related carbon-nitrogen hydrolase [Alphaproteobacteria bacterium]|nr:nitrilase-related carbon-nitrogen hydrolase [Alphaproteobacteria bacterium]MDP6254084.1 nitrilase-related carbon-nitrogen hydrolase [Alphaproteobacteria bacterium]MDP7052777.1 nitrilase-related carbon-nitrogen hydrolase [Alphaproteobacteria bacterium]MDP7229895.1 nitrilase-related carbon-nitrogen hydrolase [Alphaproteobacteria bacterium]MDP7460919.1 nitrilase-related carbon-nitrogen hydrolase [Alphaproteobacteria bacterium]
MTDARPMTVSAIQITSDDAAKDATIERMMGFLDLAGRRGSELVVLPEIWTGAGLSTEEAYLDLAEPIPGPTTDLLAQKARKYGMYIVGSMYEREGNQHYNSSPLITPEGEIMGKYWKTHLFDAPNRPDIKGGIRESDHVEAGTELPVFQTNPAKVGVSVCSDLRFPEVYRELALKGAEVIVCASAFLSPRFDHWEFFLRARATENQCWVVASGQYGVEPQSGIAFVGRSMVVDPWGTVVATASDEEGVITTDIDLNFAEEIKRRYPLMDQRRPDMYGHIGKPKDQVPLYK